MVQASAASDEKPVAPAAEALGTRLIRVFSFYVPAGRAAEHRDEVLARMAALAEAATQANVTLLHENEREIYGDTAERCRDILEMVDSPALRMASSSNAVMRGVWRSCSTSSPKVLLGTLTPS